MDSMELVKEIVASSKGKEVKGKKRLQKLAYFAYACGVTADVNFVLKDYGPFSPDVASAADMLTFLGDLSESEETTGHFKFFTTVYKLSGEATGICVDRSVKKIVEDLDQYDTLYLEMAATIHFFMRKFGQKEEAIAATKAMKPAKASGYVLQKANEILSKIA